MDRQLAQQQQQLRGRVVRSDSSHQQDAQSYAIAGGEAREQSRQDSRVLEAEIPGGQLSQHSQQRQFQLQQRSVQQLPGGGQMSQQTSSSQQVHQQVSSSVQHFGSQPALQYQQQQQQFQQRQQQQFQQHHQQQYQQQYQQQQQQELQEAQHYSVAYGRQQSASSDYSVTDQSGGQHSTMPAGGPASPPVFEQIFKNARFAQGGNALFEGRVRGNPKPKISWTRQGRPIQASNKYQLRHNQQTGEVSLLISRIGPGDEGEYTCMATNQYGEAVCTVYIQPEAAFLQQQQQTTQQQQQQQMVSQQQQQQLMQQQQQQQRGGVQRRMVGGQQHMMQMRTETTYETDSSGHTTTSTRTDRQYHTTPFSSSVEEFRVDTFEYRLIRESEFREALTRRQPGEPEVVVSARRPGPLSPPQLQGKPRASKVQEGGSATFQARLAGNPPPRITWFKDGARVRPGARATISEQDSVVSLHLQQVQPQDTGHYTMLAENQAGCVVSSAYLAVEPTTPQYGQHQVTQRTDHSQVTQIEEVAEGKALAPSFLKVPSDTEVQEGKLVRLECRTAGKPAPDVIWYINGYPVANDATHKMLINEAGNNALMITSASQRDAGTVTCVARNKSGEVSHQITLSVLEKEQVIAPKFVERFQTVRVQPGEAVSLSCRAVGAPTPRITWQKDGQPLQPSDSVHIITDGGASMIDIPCVRPEDSAWYQCTAQNAAGSTATRAKVYVDQGPAPPAAEPWRLHLPKPTKVIAPEAPLEPEIVHLKHVERSRPKPQRPEEEQPSQPPQFTHPLRDTAVAEGDRILLEARVVPLGDPTMRIEWYIDGQPLSASSRATLTHKFGYVSLSLLTVIQQDTGVYTCRAVNQAGYDETSCRVSVGPRATIETAPQHPESLEHIQLLEDANRYMRTVQVEEQYQKPYFVRELRDVLGVNEGGLAHFEAHVEPVNDSTMRIDWFKDGKPITASSRISNINNFGHVALHISQLRAEDSGVYTVRATNKVGEAFSQAQLVVHVQETVTGDLGIPEQQQYIQSVEQLEAYKQAIQKQVTADLADTQTAPRFTQPIRDAPDVPENGTAHFEGRLEPTGDSTLRVDWFKDGKPLEASSRITTFFNFGYVSLTIKQVTIYDTGVYTCVARNAAGQAQCQASLQCVGRQDIVTESQVESMQQFQYLEDSSRHQRLVEEDVSVTKMPPKFLGPLKGTTVIREGQRAHFETRVEPQNDATMKTEWLHNGRPLAPANRISTVLDFGYVALDITGAKPEDAGTYTLVARNALGQAETQAQMKVEARQAVDTSSMHRGVVEKTAQMEKSKFVEPSYDIGDYCKSKPVFIEPLKDQPPQAEGRGVHLECRLEPLNDPTMKVEWFQNGRPITIGSRFRTYCDFGFVALDVLELTTADSGEYTARATNQLGSAHTSAAVRVVSRAAVDTEPQHDGALEQIQYLEDSARQARREDVETDVNQVPTFTKPLRNVETMEGTNVHLECRLQPVGDNSMRVEWFVNDQPLKVGHRFRPAYEFDYVALDLLSVYPEDAGIYTCRATNRLGQAVTSAAIRVIAKKDHYTEHPQTMEQIQYIEDSSRYQRKEWLDEMVQIKPKFVSQLKHQENLREGQTAHFEAKVEPVTDVNLRVEWLKDGKPITVGHRHRPLHDFGYVALDIVGTIAEDNGIYTCRATNGLGYDETSAILKTSPAQKIITTSQHEATSMQQLQFLEDKSKYSRAEQVDEVTTQAPVFTTSLASVQIREGQRAHFESRLIPVSDHTMKVEWFHNGKPVKAGSRFVETNNFGFVALDILDAYPEDQGTYTCKATNALGEAVTQANLTCISKGAIDQGTLHEEALAKLRHLEQKPQSAPRAEEATSQAPVFTQPIRDLHAAEGQPLHFEGRLIPVGDETMKVEWFKNGVPLQQANRITTVNDFGFVALDLKYSQEDDSGTYTCRATNQLGQAATSATCLVQSRESLMLGSQHEGALPKLRQLEDKHISRPEVQETVVTEKPRFVTELTGPTNLVEGQSAHMEARIEPYPDANMKVEWFHNGKPLAMGSRYRTVNDFGFVSLDVLSAYPEDSGVYTVRASNRNGQATSQLNITVQPRAALIQESQHPAALQKISHLEAGRPRPAAEQAPQYERPVFGRPLKNASLVEGQPTHLEATLTPVNDPHMKVEWFYNGQPIPQGHRFKTTYDFGYVALDLLYSYPEDSGTYMCKATNLVGEAVTTCNVGVEGKQGLYLDTLDAARLEKIKTLESAAPARKEEPLPVAQKPVFVTPLKNLENLREGEHAHLECRLEPVNDPKLKVEWFVNGREIKTGHRFRTTHDFGYVALDILYSYPEDSGTYMCKATNEVGEAVNTCTIKVGERRSIYLDTQHPQGLEKIRDLESRQPERAVEVEAPKEKPRFVQELRGPTQLAERGAAHIEGRIEPIHDSDLRVDWFHNGKPLQSASRFHTTFDFGYVSLDIKDLVPEDQGHYTCKAVNKMGEATSSMDIEVLGKDNIILASQRPEGLEKIRALEQKAPQERPEEVVTYQKPMFTQPLQNVDHVSEGQAVHLEARLIPVGDPRLTVDWFRNEQPLQLGSRFKPTHDFGYVALDIAGLRPEDEGVYSCRARNDLGEAVTTASVRIRSEASIILDTQHPASMPKLKALEERVPEQRPETVQHFEKPVFTMPLTGPADIIEMQHAHFEARCVPVGDPNLKFEWFCNGKELKLGSRIKETHDFGFVTLDLMSVVPEDAGVYMCRATNLAGEAVTSASIHVHDRSSILGDAIHASAWDKIQLKEAEMNRVPEQFAEERPQQPPVFTTHLQSYDRLTEQQSVHLEATVEPKTDPNLRVEWSKNGEPLMTGTRLRTAFDFGLVTLDIMSLRGDDSGIYTCRAVNRMGEAVSTCTLKVEDKHWLLGQSQRPEALPAIAQLEMGPAPADTERPEPVYDIPVFISHLNNVECNENDKAHFECKVEPAKDPTMTIEWFWNGQPMRTGSRYTSNYDFGFVTLDIAGCQPDDAGLLVCKATNSKGTAQTSGTLKVKSKANIYLDTVHPMGPRGLEKVEEVDALMASKQAPHDAAQPDRAFQKPWFIVPLQPEFELGETEPLHLQCNVEPKEDPKLNVEWFFNGKPLSHATRFKVSNDFGFVQLDLTDVYPRDQGIYTCRAWNQAGEAFTTTTVTCKGKTGLIDWTQHPKGEMGLEAIQEMEEARKRGEGPPLTDEEGHPPVFTSQFQNLSNLSEKEVAHFEATLTPVGDQTMKVEWFYNGKPLEASHRVRTVHAFAMVVLEILDTKIEDSGTYTCRATNKWGQAEISVNLECVDKESGMKPKFITPIKDITGLKGGDSAHFECNLVPVGDPNMKVEWFHNGVPLRHSSRIKCVSDFGFVVMDLAYVQDEDSGEYTCRATNKYGSDSTTATLGCVGRGGVFVDSLQPQSLQKISELEMAPQRPGAPATAVLEPPKFVTQIADIATMQEGHSAHFEARLTPVHDPDLTVEWYRNGVKLPTGHRFRTFHDFGIVILDILYCYAEDSGEYECRAVNKVGSDVTKATLRCGSKANLILTPQMPKEMSGALDKIHDLEDASRRIKEPRDADKPKQAPRFVVPFNNVDDLREGENAHFEARLTPTDDPTLKTEWYHNGKPLKASSRYRTLCDFGFVILEISPVYPEDSGDYTCRAYNEAGEATSTATMKCTSKKNIVLESQLPKGMEQTMEKIAELEGLGVKPEQPAESEEGQAPKFVTQPTDLSLVENQLAHFECRLTPTADPTMRVEWYHNGRPLSSGSRIRSINDFGYVILEIGGIYQRDAGLYTCKAVNKHGEATVSCTLTIKSRSNVVLEPQMPHDMAGIRQLEEDLHKPRPAAPEPEEQPNPPRFVTELKNQDELYEGAAAHFDCRLEPVGDPSMRIEWFFNGRPLDTGSRMHFMDDFGFIVLDIDWTFPRDSGEYVCRATNKWGTASTKATLICKAKRDVQLESQLPQGMSGDKLRALEEGPKLGEPAAPQPDAEPPRFIKEIENVDICEGETAFFEARVEPKTDPNLRVEWYRNGVLVQTGHRFRTTFDFGYASLQILGVYPEDGGEYTCRAVNRAGQATCKSALTCRGISSVIMMNQVPKGMKKSDTLMQMEAALKQYTSDIHLTEEDIYDADRKQPPRFVTQIQDQLDLVEMNVTKFECQLAPVCDPDMKVEWFFNGRPLPHKNRFTPIYDFGYVAMNFGWVYPEDSGEYLCRATNKYGMDETRAVIKTKGKPGIVYDSQLPAGMQSVKKIQELESQWNRAPERPADEEKVPEAPQFVLKPEPCSVKEGDWARFCCRLTGHPRPRVMWLINGHTIVNGTRYKLTYDGMWRLDIPKTRQYDHGKIEVIARNAAGEAYTSCELNVTPKQDDYRAMLKNSPKPWYDYDLKQYQKDRQDDELERVFEEKVRPGISVLHQGEHQKVVEQPETEWQKMAKAKKGADYYSSYKQLEEEQLMKESKIREAGHQFAVPGEKIKHSSVAKGMAASYMQKLSEADQKPEAQPPPRRQFMPGPAESVVQGKEVHTNIQRQQQKEQRGDLEIRRNITAKETSEVEHKAQTQERVVQGKVEPSKPPFFTRKMQPCRVFDKEGAKFEVEFTGDPAPDVEWFREDFLIKSSQDFKITTTQRRSVLQIREVFSEDSGQFSCIASNRGGKAKCSANLVVEQRKQERGAAAPPNFVQTIQDTTVKAGKLARFDAKLAGTKPMDVYWLKNGRKITADMKFKILEDQEVYTLLILEPTADDSGSYECVSINKNGEARCQGQLVVESPPPAPAPKAKAKPQPQEQAVAPKIVEPMKGLIVVEGQAAMFRCRFSGHPAPTAQWLKDEKPIKPSKYFKMEQDGDAFILRISECFPEDEGTYYCVATNSAGKSTMKAPLKVQAPKEDEAPTVTPMKDVTVEEGQPARFSAKITGKPTPTVSWLRENTLIPQSRDFKMAISGNTASLEIVETYEEDSGVITCRATNSAGTSESSAKLIVESAETESESE
ncbi:titin-like isoform X4 [Amphibalanus amphitrite]|uniref:titin-like isoform X4 n=1 Tax=Amphibalanus amphitrite TaxID=1232801 RepID=UPI001C90CD35|nr:titin-like isoform X4 [Amphibalanus amphitrite]